MLGVSKRCSSRPKPRDALLARVRASAYEDRAADYSKLPHLAHDRLLKIARHYRTLAEIERSASDEAASRVINRETGSTGRSGPLTSFALVFLAIVSGAMMTTRPFNLAHAGDCLAAPNSPAQNGSHWYYHLNRGTQQKCWYVRSSEKPRRDAKARRTSTAVGVPSTSAGQISSAVTSGINGSSGQFEPPTNPTQDSASDRTPNKSAPQTTPQGNVQPLVPRGDASSGAIGQASTTTAVMWPDPPPVAPSVTPREANAAVLDAPVDPVSGTTDSAARNGERTSKVEIPIAIFPALALGLVVIGLGVRFLMKNAATGRAQEVDNAEAVTTFNDDHIKSSDNLSADEPTEDDFLSFVSAVGGGGPLDREFSGREARLAWLREEIDQRLGWAEPMQQYPSKLAS